LKNSKTSKKYEGKDISNEKLLKKYSKELLESRNELLNCETLKKRNKKFDIFEMFNDKPRSLNKLVKSFFSYMTRHYKYNDNLQKITYEEYQWFEKTYNAGLTYTTKGSFNNCFGYDFKNCYGSILGNMSSQFKISQEEGLLKKINILPVNLQYGIYKCVITSTNINFKKIFHFNDDNYYTHYDIQLVRECQKTMDNIKIELILNEPNAYVYDSKKLIYSYKIFNNWFNIITQMKEELKGNLLTKFLGSSLWGFLSAKNIEIYTEDELEEEEDDYEIVDLVSHQNGDIIYKVLKFNKFIYNTNFRLKSFITSYARCKTAHIILDNNNLFDNLLRIHTDSVILNKEFDFSSYNSELIFEDKSSGNIEFNNINNYKHICFCGEKHFYKHKAIHMKSEIHKNHLKNN